MEFTHEGFEAIKQYLADDEGIVYRVQVPVKYGETYVNYNLEIVNIGDNNYTATLIAASQHRNNYPAHNGDSLILTLRIITTVEDLNEVLKIRPCKLHIDCNSEFPCISDVTLCSITNICAICLADDSIINQIQTGCGHFFHLQCLNSLVKAQCGDGGMQAHHPCPACRTELFPKKSRT